MPYSKLFFIFIVVHIYACKPKPEAIKVGKDNCSFCKMTISDSRFGAEAITKKGKIHKYDEIKCLLNDVEKLSLAKENIHSIYFTDFSDKHYLVNSNQAVLLMSAELKSPMGGNVAAFANKKNLLLTQQKIGGVEIVWTQLFQ